MNTSPIYVEPLSNAQTRLEALIAEYQADDRLAPVTVVVPSTYAGLFLRRDIGRRGLANVRFMALPRLTELLGAPSLAARKLSPLTPLIESATVRRTAMEATGRLEPFRAHPSFHSSLRWTFRDLRLVSQEALANLENQEGLSGQIAQLHRRFRDYTALYYDRESQALAARGAVAEGRATALRDFGQVVFYLVRDFTLGELQFVQALVAAGGGSLILGATGEPGPDADAQVVAAALDQPYEAPSVPEAAGPGQSRLVIAADSREEVRWVARSIANDAYGGVPFHRIAVFYWQHEPYASLLTEQLDMADVPWTGPTPDSLASSAVGRTVKELLDLAVGELARDAVMRWLTGCPVKSLARDFSPSRWDVISRDAGVVAGASQWAERLERYATRLERSAGIQIEEISDEEAGRLLRAAADARALRRFILQLEKDLTPPGDGSSWPEFGEWVLGLIDKYLDQDAIPSQEEEQQSLDALRTTLGELTALTGVEPAATFDGFRATLDEALNAPRGRHGAFGQGVFVGPVGLSAGLRFGRVYIVGMIEGLAPPRTGDDPLLPDRERTQAQLPLRRDSLAKERYNYLAALASGQSRALTFARSDTTSRRPQYPSRWFLEEASRLNGSQVFATSLDTLGPAEWLEVIASQEDGLLGIDRGLDRLQPADAHDYDLHRLWRWRRSGRPVSGHHLAASGQALARALQMESARAAGALTVWDGDLSTASGASGRTAPGHSAAFSPTSLEAWAACPYRYFLSRVLGIGALEQPEDVASITPLERGSLVHSVLERFIREAPQAGAMPQPGQPWSEGHALLLMSIAEQEFGDALERGVTGKPLLWELAQADIRSDLRFFLDEDSKLRQTFGVSPHSSEIAFGSFRHGPPNAAASEAVEWKDADAGVLRFRGIIDRLDVSPSGGGYALVLDYKTGRAGSYDGLKKDPVDRGRRLQLPVYGLAARELLGPDVAVQAAYWFVSARGGFELRPSPPVPLDEVLAPFSRAVGTITDGIGRGLFPANPASGDSTPTGNCTYCDFDRLCFQRRARFWERKRSDPRLARYVRMADGLDVEQIAEQAAGKEK